MPEHTFFTVLRGHPDDTELAALAAVLAVLRLSGQSAAGADTAAPVRGAEAPRRASWHAARFRQRPAVSWSAP